MNATSSVKGPKSRDSHVKTSVLDVSKNEAKKEAVYVRKNKQTDNTFAKVVSNKENVIDVDVANASKAKTLLCVSCMQNVLIPCHDKCVVKHKLNVRSNARRTFSVNSRIPKSSETTFVAPKTRFSEKATQSKTLDTTSVASKSKIDEASASKARDKAVQIVLWVVDSGLVQQQMTGDHGLNEYSFKEDFDKLFGQNVLKKILLAKSSDTTINSAAQPTHDQEDLPSTSSIIVDTHKAPPVITTSDEQTSSFSL
ncbi:hypothetical protein Tco_1484598 [Tanacetum coccineum]